ncbi:MAG: zinc ribbon domain-containing protein [Desulfobacteraceae bacterium]|nr:MAG: zinc ribbon domain-containing protein [Desulfobacteraceae bacterium]
MPIFEFKCGECGQQAEYILASDASPECRSCGSHDMKKMLSAHSMASGTAKNSFPGPGDTACCGSSPQQASNCAGPGSCCGRNMT